MPEMCCHICRDLCGDEDPQRRDWTQDLEGGAAPTSVAWKARVSGTPNRGSGMTTDIAKREATVFSDIERVVQFPENSVALCGLRLTDIDTSYEDWVRIGRSIGHMARWTPWAIGDWMNFGELVYGHQAAQAVESTTSERYDVAQRVSGLAPGTVANYASICGRVALSRRRVELPFSTHEAVASLEPDEQTHWLQQAVDNDWTKEELRQAIKDAKNPPTDADAEAGDDGDGTDRMSVAEQIEEAARAVYAQASQNKSGDWIVPKPTMARLAAALGEE